MFVKKLSVLVFTLILCMLTSSVWAAFQPLGFFVVRKNLSNPNDPFLPNHMVLYSDQSSSQYDLYAVYYNDDYTYDNSTMSGQFSVLYYLSDANGRNLSGTTIATYFSVAAKGAFGYQPIAHGIRNSNGNMTTIDIRPGSEILYRNTAAHGAALITTRLISSATEYPNR